MTTTYDKTPLETLIAARDYLATKELAKGWFAKDVHGGWVQPTAPDYDSKVVAICTSGAFRGPDVGGYSMEAFNTAFHALSNAARKLFPERSEPQAINPAVQVNDHPDTTKEDVLAIFDEAIRSLS